MDGPEPPGPQRRPIVIRDATDADLPAIAAMLNREIADSPYVYAETPVSIDERRTWLAAHRSSRLPVIVAVDAAGSGELVGWAALSPYRSSSGYRFTAELSVYVAPSAQRRGVGRRLVAALHDAAHACGLHALVGSVDAGNAPSIALLQRFGFVEAARLPEVGRKFDRWRTQVLLLHVLGPPADGDDGA
jgi:phosphinothricin acetyltransferase